MQALFESQALAREFETHVPAVDPQTSVNTVVEQAVQATNSFAHPLPPSKGRRVNFVQALTLLAVIGGVGYLVFDKNRVEKPPVVETPDTSIVVAAQKAPLLTAVKNDCTCGDACKCVGPT